MTAGKFGYGSQGPEDSTSQFNVMSFIIAQALGSVRTMVLVEVMAVTNDGGVAAVGFVDAKPLVNQVDGQGNATPHGTIFNLPYFRLQGGKNAVIIDPVVGDIGIAVIADRDISAVKSTKKAANPGSAGRFDLADGVYIGGILNGVPERYVRFFADGITAKVGTSEFTLTASSSKLAFGAVNVTIDAAAIHLNGPVVFNGVASSISGVVDFGASEIKTTGPATVGSVASSGNVVGGGKSLTTHTHGGVLVGGGTTGPPS